MLKCKLHYVMIKKETDTGEEDGLLLPIDTHEHARQCSIPLAVIAPTPINRRVSSDGYIQGCTFLHQFTIASEDF